MFQSIATIDTTVLVSLQSAELLGAISVLFDRVLVPAKVREELEAGAASNLAALAAIDEFSIFQRCNDYDPALVKWLLDTREHLKKGKDEGEAEAVIQAAQRSATMVLVDDPLGREWAKERAMQCHGTIWLCRELRHQGYLTQLRPYFVRMIQRGRRLPLNEMNSYLQEFGETLIAQQEYSEYMSRSRP